MAGSRLSRRASSSISAYARLLMSSDVHAKCVNSDTLRGAVQRCELRAVSTHVTAKSFHELCHVVKAAV